MKKLLGLSASIAAATTAQGAGAALVTYDFTASIPPVTGIGPSTPLQGRFTYDDAGALLASPVPGSSAIYKAARSVSFTSAVATDASSNADDPASAVQVTDYPSQDGFLFTIARGFVGDGITVDIRFTDYTGSVFAGTTLPASLNLSDFGSATVTYSSYDSAESFSAPIDSLALVAVPVPEPATWALMLAGSALVGAGLRRRRRSAVTYA